MKRLILVAAIVFAFGVTYASNGTAEVQKAGTEQVNPNKPDEKKKDGCCSKTCDKKKSGKKKPACDKK